MSACAERGLISRVVIDEAHDGSPKRRFPTEDEERGRFQVLAVLFVLATPTLSPSEADVIFNVYRIHSACKVRMGMTQ